MSWNAAVGFSILCGPLRTPVFSVANAPVAADGEESELLAGGLHR